MAHREVGATCVSGNSVDLDVNERVQLPKGQFFQVDQILIVQLGAENSCFFFLNEHTGLQCRVDPSR